MENIYTRIKMLTEEFKKGLIESDPGPTMTHTTSLPFAVTAKTPGFPRKLYTPIMVANLRAPAVAYVNAMWDTGADCCYMTPSLAKHLCIDFEDTVSAEGVTGRDEMKVGDAYVSLIAGGGIETVAVAVASSNFGRGDFSFIVGMDFIRKGSLAITHADFQTMLSFRIPSSRPIDFTSDLDFDAAKGMLPLSHGKEDLIWYSQKAAVKELSHYLPKGIFEQMV